MRTTHVLAISLAAVLAMGALSNASADQKKPHEDEICKKYMEYNEFGHEQSLKVPAFQTFCQETCKDKNLLQCDETVAVLRGKSDPAPLHGIFKDFFHYIAIQNQGHCVANRCGKRDSYEAAIAWGMPEAKATLLDQIDSEEKLKELHCRDKADMYRALWYLGDKTAADTMIKGYNNLLCTNDHFNNTVPILDAWGLTDAQLDAIEKVCVDGIFGEKLRNAKSSFKGCFTFFAKRGKVSEDGMEYLKMNAEKDTFALRALAAVDGKGSKAKFTKLLAESEKEEFKRDKKGKKTDKTFLTWRGGREDAIFSAVALFLAGDKKGTGAVDYWLSFTPDNELANRDGWERLFVIGAPFWPAADQAKLRKVLEKAFAAGLKAMAKNDKLTESMTRAAFGLAQIGSNKGLDLILAAIDGDDNSRRKEVMTAIGGTQNYQGGRYIGAGGLKIGGKDGLAKADVDKIEQSLLKRAKFLKSSEREIAVRAILDLRGRSKAAGL